MNLSTASSSNDLANQFHSTPNRTRETEPPNELSGLLSRILQLSVEVQRKEHLTLQQRNSLDETLEILLLLTEKLLIQGNTKRLTASLTHLNQLVDGLTQLAQRGAQQQAPLASQAAPQAPQVPSHSRAPSLHSTFTRTKSSEEHEVRYGIFQDRISNLSPSVSTKSIYELKLHGDVDENSVEYDDEFDDEDEMGALSKVPLLGEFRIPQLAYTPNKKAFATPTRMNSSRKLLMRPSYLDYR